MPHQITLQTTITTASFNSRYDKFPGTEYGAEIPVTILSHATEHDVTTYENLTINIDGKSYTYKGLDYILSRARKFTRAVNAFNK